MTAKPKIRVVLDTNVLVSATLFPESIPRQALRKAYGDCEVVFSEETIAELNTVLLRDKFNRFMSVNERTRLGRAFVDAAKVVDDIVALQACRDAGDDRFLALAVAAGARYLVTGDADLLALVPFRDLAIVTPAEFLKADLR